MSDLPQKNTNVDRNSKHTTVVAKPGPYEARVINNLDPEYQGALTVQLLKTNTSGNVNFAEGQVYIARYLSPFAGQTPSWGTTKNDTYKAVSYTHLTLPTKA